MMLKEFCVNQKWCMGFAEVRRLVCNEAIKINGTPATNADVKLKNDDVITCGKHRTAIFKEN